MNDHIYTPLLLALLVILPAANSAETDELKIEEVRNCITTRSLKNTAVLDDQNILFFMVGRTVFHNILPKQCKGLAKSGRFNYSSLAGALCKFDSIDVYGVEGIRITRTCRLGRFYPTTKEGVPAIIASLGGPPRLEAIPPAEIEEMGAVEESIEVEESDELEEIVIRSYEAEELTTI